MKYVMKRFKKATEFIVDILRYPKDYKWFAIPMVILLLPLWYIAPLFDFKGYYD